MATSAQLKVAKPFWDKCQQLRGHLTKLEAEMAENEGILNDLKHTWNIKDTDLDPNANNPLPKKESK